MLRIAQEALTFDDVLLLPGYSDILPRDVELKTKLTRDIHLHIPLVSSAMDTVTESRLAIAMAQEGGIGILHKNMTVEEQARQVRLVKKYESGVVRDPIIIDPEEPIARLIELTKINNISGVPVVKGEQLVGIVTSRDLRFEDRFDQPVSAIMTPKEKLVTAKEGASTEEIKELLHKFRIEKVLLVDDEFHLKGMVTNTEYLPAIGLGDHLCISFDLLCYTEEKRDSTPKPDYNRADFRRIGHILENTDWREVLQNKNVQEAWDYFSGHLQAILQEYVPCRKTSKKKRNINMTDSALRLRRRKEKQWKRYLLTGQPQHFATYRKTRNALRALSRKLKKQF